MSFVHLNVHTEYSLHRGLCKIPELFARARELGMEGLAFTDLNTLAGVPEILRTARDYPEIMPIFGTEILIADDRRGGPAERAFHLILLAKNLAGYHNLVKLVSLAATAGEGQIPWITHAQLQAHHDGLICLSAGLDGELAAAIENGRPDEARETAEWYRTVFGTDYYLEVSKHVADEGTVFSMSDNLPAFSKYRAEHFIRQSDVNRQLFVLSYSLGIPAVATNDVRFVRREDAVAFDVLTCLPEEKRVRDAARYRCTHTEYLKSEGEMVSAFPDHPEVLDNTGKLLNKVERYDPFAGPLLPRVSDHPDRDLRDAVMKGARERYGTVNAKLKNRAEGEIASFEKAGYSAYPLILKEFLDWARAAGYPVGPGRGSAPGSVVAYCLGITDIDPLRYGLLSERFLNPDRIQLPDIDLDLGLGGPDSLMRHLQERYGRDHVAHVVTFRHYTPVRALRLSARALGYPVARTESLVRLLPKTSFFEVEDKRYETTIENCMNHLPKMVEKLDQGSFEMEELLQCAARIDGTLCQAGVHACALILAPGPVTDFVPVMPFRMKDSGETFNASQFGAGDVEDFGLLKLDLLALIPLDIINKTISYVGEPLDLDDSIFEDPETLALFTKGDTVGIFQFEEDWMKAHMMEMEDFRFRDVLALNALFRPLLNNYMVEFLLRRCGVVRKKYPVKAAREILEDTCGLILFQEQMMLLAQRIGGFTPGESDRLRKAVARRDDPRLESLQHKFVEQGIAKGYEEEDLESLWMQFISQGAAAYPKAHIVAYCTVSMKMAFLKAHRPREFFKAAVACYRKAGMDTEALIVDARDHDIAIC